MESMKKMDQVNDENDVPPDEISEISTARIARIASLDDIVVSVMGERIANDGLVDSEARPDEDVTASAVEQPEV